VRRPACPLATSTGGRIRARSRWPAAGKRNSVTILLRVDVLLPSNLYRGGVPRSLERITLERAPKPKK
jgi:hypothetical protein